jgi:hypothetical protein
MKTNLIYALVLFFISACASSPSNQTDVVPFVSHQKLSLSQASDGRDGTLEVLRDRRLTTDDINRLEQHDPDNDPSHDSEYSDTSLKKARLELKAEDGHVVSSMELEKPYAKLDAVPISPHHRAILVTQDFSIGMGSYNGPITKVIDVSRGLVSRTVRVRSGSWV